MSHNPSNLEEAPMLAGDYLNFLANQNPNNFYFGIEEYEPFTGAEQNSVLVFIVEKTHWNEKECLSDESAAFTMPDQYTSMMTNIYQTNEAADIEEVIDGLTVLGLTYHQPLTEFANSTTDVGVLYGD